MWSSLLADASVYVLLLRFDADIAEGVKIDGCACGGVLHSAKYPRKPRGARLPDGYSTRHSFCCANDGCRRRRTPPSLRFLGRKVYVGIVVVLVTAMRHGVTDRRGMELRRAVGASRETLARWQRWWREVLPSTDFWKQAKALLREPIAIDELPLSLLAAFASAADETTRVVRLLDFIKPVTTGATGAWRSISMAD